jgi:hypothetical protein
MRGANRTVKQVLRFVPHVSYRKRFAFFEIAQRVMEQELAGQFDRALQETIATAR